MIRIGRKSAALSAQPAAEYIALFRLTVWLLVLFLCASWPYSPLAAAQSSRFSYNDTQFLLDGKPFQIRAGELHYNRIPRAYWHDRIQKAKAMGLNTLTVTAYWNVHEKTPGVFDFSGEIREALADAGVASRINVLVERLLDETG